jgi:hypothetical protein
MKRTLGLGLLLLSLSTGDLGSADSAEAQPVSVIQLIANPERYDGKRVSVMGFLELSREADILYFGREDYQNVILPNGIWVDRGEQSCKERDKLNLKYVKVGGVFRAGHAKSAYYFAGELTDITNCNFWSDPEHPRIERYKGRSDRQ